MPTSFEKRVIGSLDEARRARKRTGQRIYTYYAAEYGGYQIGHPIGNRRRATQRGEQWNAGNADRA